MIFRAEGHNGLTRWLADFLEPRVMDSHVTVIIPFENRVILVGPLDGAHFPSRYSEVAQTFDPIPGISCSPVADGSASCGLLARSESGVAARYGRGS
jgi:hypothetical protein